MVLTQKEIEFYGYKMVQNPSAAKLALYVGSIDAGILRDLVSVDNAVKWDDSSGVWRSGGRNRSIEEAHWKSIEEFLSSGNNERILPSAIVISVQADAFKFNPFPKMPEIARTLPGMLTIRGTWEASPDGTVEPCPEVDRPAWVLDGQHRITAFRNWSMPDPYPVNVIILQAWKGNDYEDVMRHQTYELNMGRPLSEDFKAAIREQFNSQLGHKEYRRQIALSWIRKDIEGRGDVFSPDGIVGAPKLRPKYVVSMSFIESVIALAFESDSHLKNNYTLENMSQVQVTEVGRYLFNFFEGVRLSIGRINPNVKGTIGPEPEVAAATDYWDIATTTKHKQRLLHNVGLKAVTRGLLHKVMRGSALPQTPQEVALLLDHMRGILWHDHQFQSKKDDWTGPLAEALAKMYESKGTATASKKYQLVLNKLDKNSKNIVETYTLAANGW